MTLEEILAALDNVESMSTADLEALRDSIVAVYNEVRESGDDLSPEDLAALEELAAGKTKVQAQIDANAEADAAAAARLAELDAEMNGDDGDGDGDDADGADADAADGADAGDGSGDDGDGGDGDGTDAAGDDDGEDGDDADNASADERELVTASGLRGNRQQRNRLEAMRRNGRRQDRQAPATIGNDVVLAAAGVPGFVAGSRITTAEQFGQALANMNEAIGPFQGQEGDPFQKFPVLTVKRDFAADLTVTQRMGPDAVGEVWDRAVSRHLASIDEQVARMGDDVVLAAGGPCVAAEPDYSVEFIGGNTRPFSTAFPTAKYSRGRVQYYPPLCFDGSDAGTTYAQIGRKITQAQDEAGYGSGEGLTTPKGCVRIDCPDFETCGLDILIECMTIGNWVDRTFPEYVRAWQQMIDVYYARKYEQNHIAQVVSGSTLLTDGSTSPFGAVLSFTSTILRVIAHTDAARRAVNRQWRLVLPSWAIILFKIDLMRYLNATATGLAGLNVTDAQVISLLRNLGVNVSTYIDEAGPTTQGDAQLLAMLDSGPVPELPGSIRAFLFPEGQWIRGTGGEFSTGPIRDSGLIQANDFQTFFEEWTAMCQRGCVGDSFVIDAELCPSGVAGGTVVLDCFGGESA